MPNREVITINVGGAGLRIGTACTKQYMAEHGIGNDGNLTDSGSDNTFSSFFEETGAGQYIPRQVSVDLEPSQIDEMKTGSLAQVFHPQFLLSGKEDAANNFARGHYTVGKQIMDQVNDRLRKLVDNSENVQGFIVNHSLGGGTGSGLGALILERLAVDYRKKSKIGVEVLAGDMNGRRTPCETYNQMLGTHWLLDHTEVSLIFDNSALGGICRKKLDINPPGYDHVNSLIAKAVSNATAGLRYDGELNVDLNELTTNLVPFPRLHFMTSSLAGLQSANQKGKSTVRELSDQVFQPHNMSVHYPEFDPVEDKYMAVEMSFRGGMAKSQKEANAAVQWLKQNNKVSFVEWCPTGMKLDFHEEPVSTFAGDRMALPEGSVGMLGNNVATYRVFRKNNKRYDQMYSQRAYVHHYVSEGMEEGKLAEAREDMGFLERDYLDILSEHDEGDDDDDEFRR